MSIFSRTIKSLILVGLIATLLGESACSNTGIQLAPSSLSGNANLAGANNQVGVGALTLSQANPFDFGLQPAGVPVSKILIIQNNGTGAVSALNFDPSGLPGGFSFQGTGANIPGYVACTINTTLAPQGGNCAFVVTFVPDSASALSGNLNISFFNGTSQQIIAWGIRGSTAEGALVAPGVNPSTGVAAPANFASVVTGGNAVSCVTVSNNGLAAISGFAVAAQPNSSPFIILPASTACANPICGATLAAGASCDVAVEFAPSAAGTPLSPIVVSYSDGVTLHSNVEIAIVQGTAVVPPAPPLPPPPPPAATVCTGQFNISQENNDPDQWIRQIAVAVAPASVTANLPDLLYDSTTANYLCYVAGFSQMLSMGAYSAHYGRSNYDHPGGAQLLQYTGNRWIDVSSASPAQWLSSLTCTCGAPQPLAINPPNTSTINGVPVNNITLGYYDYAFEAGADGRAYVNTNTVAGAAAGTGWTGWSVLPSQLDATNTQLGITTNGTNQIRVYAWDTTQLASYYQVGTVNPANPLTIQWSGTWVLGGQ